MDISPDSDSGTIKTNKCGIVVDLLCETPAMKRSLITFFVLLIGISGWAQIREVKSRAEDHKRDRGNHTSESRYSGSTDDGDSFIATFFGDLIFGSIYNGFSLAQFYQLDNAREEDWRISGEFKVNGGVNFSNNTYFDSQSIRGNWGLFSTQVRRMNVNDVSGGVIREIFLRVPGCFRNIFPSL